MARIFGKLIDGEIVFKQPNEPVVLDGEQLVTNDPDTMLSAGGYKLVELTERPSENCTATWSEGERIITQVWREET